MIKLLFALSLLFIPSPVKAEISASFKAGAMIIGTAGNAECTNTTEGALRWSSTDKSHEMCDGAAWKKLTLKSNIGNNATPQAGTGYFVLSHDTWNGNLTGLSGADSKCLTDLTNYNWLNKGDATARGLVNSSNVKAFLCTTGTCQNVNNNTIYTFAVAGRPTIGGASFTSNGSGQGPDNPQNWSGTNYFGTAAEYWTGRAVGTAILWGGVSGSCSTWASGSNGTTGNFGSANNSDGGRWRAGTSATCDLPKYLICLVHP